MSYTTELIAYAKRLEQRISVGYDPERNRYIVDVDKVCFQEGYMMKNVSGQGFTIEDACCDYIRKCRGGYMVHYITDERVFVL